MLVLLFPSPEPCCLYLLLQFYYSMYLLRWLSHSNFCFLSIRGCPSWERSVLPEAGQGRRPDGGPEETEEDHLQPSPAVRAGAGLCRDSLPGHHPEGEAGGAHTPAREQDTGESAALGSAYNNKKTKHKTTRTRSDMYFIRCTVGHIFPAVLVRKTTTCHSASERMSWDNSALGQG